MLKDRFIARKKRKVIKMWRDIVFCVIIIIVIVVLDFFIQDYIKNSVEEMTVKLDDLKQEVSNKEEDKINEVDTKEITEAWEERYKILASVIEHDELEKVEKNITGIYSALESKELSEVISELDESMFILRHIKDKYSFKIENVF
jgi:Tfp pilus assembly protein PilO